MIFSSIYVKENNKKYPQAIQTAIDYLKTTDFTNVSPGKYQIQGDDIYAQVSHTTTDYEKNRLCETHEEYIDVQFLISGKEKLGFAPYTENLEIKEHDKERDLIFYKKAENLNFVISTPGCFAIFFTNDVHMPCVAANVEPMEIKKVVVKVKESLL